MMMLLQSLLVVALAFLASSSHAIDFPFRAKKQYTPLIFFKLPNGASPHSELRRYCCRRMNQSSIIE